MTQPDLYRDSPQQQAQHWRIAAETSKQQFPDDTGRYEHYMAEARRLEGLQ